MPRYPALLGAADVDVPGRAAPEQPAAAGGAAPNPALLPGRGVAPAGVGSRPAVDPDADTAPAG
ncbi:hypothetical protein ACFO0M_27345 [Micromonospora mangrovi]|uniref:Uncharacterized protein n=2 Tax=Micromonospora TaxID=1873 RepID=A0AAU8HIB9_9ACTN